MKFHEIYQWLKFQSPISTHVYNVYPCAILQSASLLTFVLHLCHAMYPHWLRHRSRSAPSGSDQIDQHHRSLRSSQSHRMIFNTIMRDRA